MRNRFESDLKRGGDPNQEIAELLWTARGGIAQATILPSGEIVGVRLDNDSGKLIEVVIRKPTTPPTVQ
jgi:hypothetical protein